MRVWVTTTHMPDCQVIIYNRVIASAIESVGDYYACARLSGDHI